MDLLDHEAFGAATRRLDGLREAVDSGSRLIPDFENLARDIFAIFYKFNVVRFDAGERTRAQLLRRRIVDWVLETPGLEASKESTRLDMTRSGMATASVLRQALEMLRTRSWFNEEDLLDQWRLHQLSAEHTDLSERLEALDMMREAADPDDDDTIDALGRLEESLREDQLDVGRQSEELVRQHESELDRLPVRAENLIKERVQNVASHMEQAEEAAVAYGSGLGVTVRGTAAVDKLTLGEKLLSSEKLRKMAELAGLFKYVARSSRNRILERRPSAVHSIDRGSDLARVLSSDLALLRHPLLRQEFMRRFADGLLFQYAIQSPDASGRGPLVVCIDASGSMRGPRELWAKAIALTFLEIARRERRAFRAIVFSSAPRDLRRFELLESALDRRLRPPQVDPRLVVDFAEYFPGGGTDFESPLSAAVETLRESRFRHGDIIFITDGSASVSRKLLDELAIAKKDLEFMVYAVLVDVQGGTTESLNQFADEILRVSELTADELRPVFRKV
jgi:uncharacterized protein with von Willebrand factor type A (vWA) domain